MSTTNPNCADWLRKANNDLLNIANNLASSSVPWDTVCFPAQQAAEKLIKSYLCMHGQPPPRSHDLVALLAQCATIDPTLAPLEADRRSLTYYAVAARYPDPLFEPDEQDGRAMIAAAERVRAALLPRLPQ